MQVSQWGPRKNRSRAFWGLYRPEDEGFLFKYRYIFDRTVPDLGFVNPAG